MNRKICPSCNDEFTCTGKDDCWCESYHIQKKDMYRLLQTFDDCICPECLKKYESQ